MDDERMVHTMTTTLPTGSGIDHKCAGMRSGETVYQTDADPAVWVACDSHGEWIVVTHCPYCPARLSTAGPDDPLRSLALE